MVAPVFLGGPTARHIHRLGRLDEYPSEKL
jgi:hypothetical protein